MSLPLMPGDEPIEVKFKPQVRNVPSSAQPVTGDVPGCTCPGCRGEQYPRGMQPGMIRGRYDFSLCPEPQSELHGQVRWRAPGTMQVFDENGCRQWTYREELPDGTLVDGARRWVPDPPPVGRRPPVSLFNWGQMGDFFDNTRFP